MTAADRNTTADAPAYQSRHSFIAPALDAPCDICAEDRDSPTHYTPDSDVVTRAQRLLDGLAWEHTASEARFLITDLLAERDAAVARADELEAAIREHENLHRPVGPDGSDGPIEMDGWPCCDDDRRLWAAADRGTDR